MVERIRSTRGMCPPARFWKRQWSAHFMFRKCPRSVLDPQDWDNSYVTSFLQSSRINGPWVIFDFLSLSQCNFPWQIFLDLIYKTFLLQIEWWENPNLERLSPSFLSVIFIYVIASEQIECSLRLENGQIFDIPRFGKDENWEHRIIDPRFPD